MGSSLGLALLVTIAATHTAAAEPGGSQAAALTEGFRHAFVAGGCVSLAGSVLALVVLVQRVRAAPAVERG